MFKECNKVGSMFLLEIFWKLQKFKVGPSHEKILPKIFLKILKMFQSVHSQYYSFVALLASCGFRQKKNDENVMSTREAMLPGKLRSSENVYLRKTQKTKAKCVTLKKKT